jgi:methylisocitrate lyase
VDPKRCGHLDGKQVVEADAFAEKVAAAATARQHLVVIARTDARATHGFDEAVRRGRRYLEAGADVIFPEALESEDEFAAYAKEIEGPLLANITEFGRSPLLSAERLAELGYRIVIFPVSAARIAAKTVGGFYEELLAAGSQRQRVEDMMTRDELYELIGYDEYAQLDRWLARDESS